MKPWSSLSASSILSILCLCMLPLAAYAAEERLLPVPLTLEAALQLADSQQHFQLQSAEQGLQQALAELEQSGANNDVSVNLSGRLSQVGLSDFAGAEGTENDSVVSLFVRKPIYDFGKSESRDDLARLKAELKQLEKNYLIDQRRLNISQKYFDVLNADNEFLRHNEDLAMGYIHYDRAVENQGLGLASELDVLERQVAYERIRQNRYNSESMQRLTRILLAEELGFPESPPSDVVLPELIERGPISDDMDKLVEQAYRHSLDIRIQQKRLDIAKQALKLAGHTSGPRVDAELELSDYAREGSTRDDWRASIQFDFPLYSGATNQSAVRVATAQQAKVLSDLQRVRSEVRVAVLTLWQSIRQNSLRLEGELKNQEFRDMTLDRSRAEYELEFKTDLGDSMVLFSESRMRVYQARFALEMAWRRLEALLGKEYLDSMAGSSNNNG